MSEFWLQLRKKQLAKRMYWLSEKQFYLYFKKAQKSDWVTWDKMLEMLERRLDNVVFRSNIARTRMQARQFVWHGHFLLNWKRITIPSIEVKVWDVIELREKLKWSPLYKWLLEELAEFSKKNKWKISSTRWLEIDPKNIVVKVIALPWKDDFESIIDIQKIVEFYSK